MIKSHYSALKFQTGMVKNMEGALSKASKAVAAGKLKMISKSGLKLTNAREMDRSDLSKAFGVSKGAASSLYSKMHSSKGRR